MDERVPTPKNAAGEDELDTDQETDRLLGQQYNDDNGYYDQKVSRSAETERKRAVHNDKEGGGAAANSRSAHVLPARPPASSYESEIAAAAEILEGEGKER